MQSRRLLQGPEAGEHPAECQRPRAADGLRPLLLQQGHLPGAHQEGFAAKGARLAHCLTALPDLLSISLKWSAGLHVLLASIPGDPFRLSWHFAAHAQLLTEALIERIAPALQSGCTFNFLYVPVCTPPDSAVPADNVEIGRVSVDAAELGGLRSGTLRSGSWCTPTVQRLVNYEWTSRGPC